MLLFFMLQEKDNKHLVGARQHFLYTHKSNHQATMLIYFHHPDVMAQEVNIDQGYAKCPSNHRPDPIFLLKSHNWKLLGSPCFRFWRLTSLPLPSFLTLLVSLLLAGLAASWVFSLQHEKCLSSALLIEEEEVKKPPNLSCLKRPFQQRATDLCLSAIFFNKHIKNER